MFSECHTQEGVGIKAAALSPQTLSARVSRRKITSLQLRYR